MGIGLVILAAPAGIVTVDPGLAVPVEKACATFVGKKVAADCG